LAGSLKKREMGSTSPGSVSLKRLRDIAVCSVLALEVSTFGAQQRT
jgi:hypothetical protein